MKEIIDIFRMTEIEPKIRAKVIIEMGRVINHQYSSNLTEPIVFELVTILDPENKILTDEHYLKLAGK